MKSMDANQGICFFLSEAGKGNFPVPVDCARKIASMSRTVVPQREILDEFYQVCGRDCCVESPLFGWDDPESDKSDKYNPYNVNNCCNDHNETTFDQRGHVTSILIDHTARNKSHFGDWDDFDPHKKCRVPSFELPVDISKLWKLESLDLQHLPIVGGIPPEYDRLKNLKRLGLVQNDQWKLSRLPETRVPQFNQLEELHLEGFLISDETVEDISGISTLKKLSIVMKSNFATRDKLKNVVLDLSPLEWLENLEELVLIVPNVHSLRGMVKLKKFFLKSNWKCSDLTTTVDLTMVEDFLHRCPQLDNVDITIPVTGRFSRKFFEHPTLKSLKFHTTYGGVATSIDFTSEDFPPCKYSGKLSYELPREIFYFCGAVYAVGDLPESYRKLGVISADEHAQQIVKDEKWKQLFH